MTITFPGAVYELRQNQALGVYQIELFTVVHSDSIVL